MKTEAARNRILAEAKHLEKVGGGAIKLRNSTFERFPIIFTLLSTFGVVATFYGFEKVIDEIQFFAERPWSILLVGLITLVATGALYKKVQ